MLKPVALLFLGLLAHPASAQNCPDFFRFVDFGLEAGDGVLYRGGPILRAESLGGSPLLQRERTVCREVPEIAQDGHGNPIPVVASISYDPERSGLNLAELRVAALDGIQDLAEENARAHRAAVIHPESDPHRGDASVCTVYKKGGTLSCQIVSPYPVDAPLIVYCDAMECTMPLIVLNARIGVSAIWPSDPSSLKAPETAGPAIVDKVRQISEFLAPLTSGL